jgi:2-amino-4-hydroxy-6-hydroxymethyldihydropteridine diphosphokinase
MLQIERDWGRDRAGDGSDRWARARSISTCCSTVTRPSTNPACAYRTQHLHERAFALVPLVESRPTS